MTDLGRTVIIISPFTRFCPRALIGTLAGADMCVPKGPRDGNF